MYIYIFIFYSFDPSFAQTFFSIYFYMVELIRLSARMFLEVGQKCPNSIIKTTGIIKIFSWDLYIPLGWKGLKN